ncbi:hypothetical protein GJ496_009079 [Pomphorhynchus laevis]|nr:hypothetical protein GJ496_009079 [Pomphorhynchus laevis]
MPAIFSRIFGRQPSIDKQLEDLVQQYVQSSNNPNYGIRPEQLMQQLQPQYGQFQYNPNSYYSQWYEIPK